MASVSTSVAPPLPPAVVPGVSAAAATVDPAAPVAPAAPAALTGGGNDQAVFAALQVLMGLVTQLLALQAAQGGAAAVQGGGALGAPAGSMSTFTNAGTSSAAPSMSILGGANSADYSVSGGSAAPSFGAAAAAAAAPAAVLPAATAAPVVVGGGAAAAPAAQAAVPQIDVRRLTGTPHSEGSIAAVLSAARATAGAAKSEGQYIVMTDSSGAQLQVHAHGAWAAYPDRIGEGIRTGFIEVHVHPDGTLHLHDVK